MIHGRSSFSHVRPVLLAWSATALACATAQTPTPDQQIAQMREELNSSRRAQEELRGRLERLEARVDARPTTVATLAAPTKPIDPLQSLPVVRLEAPARRGAGPAAPDVDTSIPFRESASQGPVVYEHTVKESEEPINLNDVVARQNLPSGKVRAAVSNESKTDDEFQSAVTKYNAGQYSEASEGFRIFASRHPKHPAANEALYMSGMALVSASRCPEAKPMFESVVREHPGTEVAGRALFAEAKCEANVGHEDAARSLFNRVVSEHPTSSEATQAKSALAELSGNHAP